jgi:hypothetical protein
VSDKIPPLWGSVLRAGLLADSIVFDDLTFGEEHPSSTPELTELIEKAGLRGVNERNLDCFFKNVRGLGGFMDEAQTKAEFKIRWNSIFAFIEGNQGCALCRSIILAESLGKLKEIREDMESTGFVHALSNYAETVIEKENAEVLLRIADDIDDDKWQLINYAVSPLTREEHELIHKRKNNAKRNASRKTEKAPSTSDILKRFWLPLSLWRMSAGEIIDTITMLKSGGTADDYERDCKKVEKAVRTLGLRRYELEPDV